MKSVKRLYIAAKILNIVALIHAILLFLCNLLGSWVGYHLMGFGWAFWQLFATGLTVLSFLHSIFARAEDYTGKDRWRYVGKNLLWLIVSIPVSVISVSCSAEWGFFYELFFGPMA